MSHDNNQRQFREWLPYLLLIIVLVAFWMTASLVDVALWTQWRWPEWMAQNFQIIWLALHSFLLPLLLVMVLRPRLNAFLAFLSAAFLGSVAWDLIYSWLTRGRLISDSMVKWFAVGYGNLVFGVNEAGALWFYIARVVIGLMLLYALYVRINRSDVFSLRKRRGENPV
ncbi:MAG: hypothetical protein KJ964_05850 [Verrucomicrobia bacterium]|nr:hypothetical protein [Verrucomicrobiota bacterium]MBU1735705.1 hypothetical protein [Verrucomicrobiota bacterium]MBU1856445.1 hypothetical protein [Verrucomicrobiota bacterium]